MSAYEKEDVITGRIFKRKWRRHTQSLVGPTLRVTSLDTVPIKSRNSQIALCSLSKGEPMLEVFGLSGPQLAKERLNIARRLEK